MPSRSASGYGWSQMTSPQFAVAVQDPDVQVVDQDEDARHLCTVSRDITGQRRAWDSNPRGA